MHLKISGENTYRFCGNGLRCEQGKCAKIGKVGASCDKDLDCDVSNLVQCNETAKKCVRPAQSRSESCTSRR